MSAQEAHADHDIPLPAPTTLASHIIGDRLLSESRSRSSSSRTSSRNSQSRRITRSRAMDSEEDMTSSEAISRRTPTPHLAKRRRRAYSIKDESHPIVISSSVSPQAPEASSSRIKLDDDPKEIAKPAITNAISKLPTGLAQPEPLSAYSCPICLCPPTNATLTPCGHICCGECLFTAVRTAMQNAYARMTPDPPAARCPVCRAIIKGWDGRGGGVIGLKARTVLSL